ncbi:MAG: ATP-binding cassette domain-containing protein, partial [Clostridia bacterium]|nr:ATP-binding cassette domain-containing protein [Clostridia bacterium]
EKEPDSGIFRIHDEGEFFTEKCCVFSSGDPFENLYYSDFDSIEDAIQEWCSKMGVERDEKSEEEMILAAKRANIHDYVMGLPNDYDTEVGERGVKLSGGQKQRISIARAFLKDPAILILDEATSALDNMTEMQVQRALSELSVGRTTLVVAHRLSTVKNADEILVVTDGAITERGTHEELMAKGGTYKDLYALQFRDNDTFE